MGRIICVHGIGDEPPDFWKPWATAIKAAIGDGDIYDGAWWEGALGDSAHRGVARGRALVRPLDQRRGARAAREDQLRDHLNALLRVNERRIQDAQGDQAKALPRGGLWDSWVISRGTWSTSRCGPACKTPCAPSSWPTPHPR